MMSGGAMSSFAQEHFVGVNTSSRTGIINASMNPAELANLSRKYEVNISGLSFNFSNNIVSLSDLDGDTDLEDLIFDGNSTVNANFDAEFSFPGFAMKWKQWGFAITSKGYVKASLIDVDPNLGEGIINSEDLAVGGSTVIGNDYNQRMNGVSWGEIALSAGRTVFEDDHHKFNAGLSLKLLFPGSYSNFGVDAFHGTLTNAIDPLNPNLTTVYLHSTNANLDFSYSGNLADSFQDTGDYTGSIFGGLHGFATDLGVNYQWKDPNDPKKYKINAGMALKNIGTMTFTDDNNASNSYVLSIPQATPLNPGLDLSIFDGTESLTEVEQILLNSGYLTKPEKSKDFKVKLPTTFSIYGDFKIYTKFYITGQIQQRLQDNEGNGQVTAQNSWSIIPRANLGFFEGYIPISHSEFAGGNVGLGFRLGGFYLGSGSVITALMNDSKQIDLNMGFRWAFL